MNDKESTLHKIVDIVVECCAMQVADGKMSVTKELVLGACRTENVVMTRCILVRMIVFEGYSVSTAAMLLNKSIQAVRHLLQLAQTFHNNSRAYRIAEAEATLRCKNLPNG